MTGVRLSRVVLVASVLVVGCAPRVRTTMIGEPQPSDPERREIEVYSAKVPDCPFEEIAIISAVGELPRLGTTMKDLLDALKERAWELGGHALVGLTERPATKAQGESLAATVVRFTGNECRNSARD